MGLTDLTSEEGQTPLEPDEKEGLLIPSITTRSELNEVEQRNIEEAIRWTIDRRRKFSAAEILTHEFVRELHRRMFGKVWRWAGEFRLSNKNIGVDKHSISTELRMLLDDSNYWLDHKTFGQDETAVRFKHRIVSIHCFANGNGRHSRLLGDMIVEKILGGEIFSWGGKTLVQQGDFRMAYLNALRAADKGDYTPLLAFARS